MKVLLKKGFTLVELMIVIAIIGVLAAALSTQMPRVRESARAMRCKANLRNLAQAATSERVSRDSKTYVRASPVEAATTDREVNSAKLRYLCDSSRNHRGWVSWSNSAGSWPWPSDSSRESMMTRSTFYGEKMSSGTIPTAYLSVTNGALWPFVGKDINTYVCDVHRAAAERKTGKAIYRSYVMNWVADDGLDIGNNSACQLLFAELPAREKWLSNSQSPDGADSVLDPDKNEYIGFNHKVGKRYAAHVVFADGHVESLLEPISSAGGSPSDTDLKALTENLCNGEEIESDIRKKMR